MEVIDEVIEFGKDDTRAYVSALSVEAITGPKYAGDDEYAIYLFTDNHVVVGMYEELDEATQDLKRIKDIWMRVKFMRNPE